MESPATQNVAEWQDTGMRNMRTGPLTELAAFESMLTGAVQLPPSKVTTFPPPPSTAAQKLLLGQDTTGQEVTAGPAPRHERTSALEGDHSADKRDRADREADLREEQNPGGPGRWLPPG
jgi:hypothetical protein